MDVRSARGKRKGGCREGERKGGQRIAAVCLNRRFIQSGRTENRICEEGWKTLLQIQESTQTLYFLYDLYRLRAKVFDFSTLDRRRKHVPEEN